MKRKTDHSKKSQSAIISFPPLGVKTILNPVMFDERPGVKICLKLEVICQRQRHLPYTQKTEDVRADELPCGHWRVAGECSRTVYFTLLNIKAHREMGRELQTLLIMP